MTNLWESGATLPVTSSAGAETIAMRNTHMKIAILALLLATAGFAHAASVMLTVENHDEIRRSHAVAVFPASLLGTDTVPGTMTATMEGGHPVAVQVDDLNGDGVADEACMVLDMPPLSARVVTINTALPWDGLSNAEARIGWRYENYAVMETDRIVYGLYGIFASHFVGGLQWDCYGKRPEAWGLSFDRLLGVDYHTDNDVAVDFLTVGNTLSLGGLIVGDGRPLHGITARYEQKVLCSGPVRAGIQMDIHDFVTPGDNNNAPYGGKYEGTAQYFVYEHNDFIDARVKLLRTEFHAANSEQNEYFGSGVRRIGDGEEFRRDAMLGFVSVWGQLEGVIGKTGLAVMFPPTQFRGWREMDGDENAHAFFIGPAMEVGKPVEYRLRMVGVWQYGGMANELTFGSHVEDLASRFNRPLTITPTITATPTTTTPPPTTTATP